MDETLKAKLEAAISACADKAAKPDTSSVEALQYTQAAANAANALIGLMCAARENAKS